MHSLKEGDKNITFFHNRAKGRREKNTIKRLKNKDGVRCEEEKEIMRITTKYFEDLFEILNLQIKANVPNSF